MSNWSEKVDSFRRLIQRLELGLNERDTDCAAEALASFHTAPPALIWNMARDLEIISREGLERLAYLGPPFSVEQARRVGHVFDVKWTPDPDGVYRVYSFRPKVPPTFVQLNLSDLALAGLDLP